MNSGKIEKIPQNAIIDARFAERFSENFLNVATATATGVLCLCAGVEASAPSAYRSLLNWAGATRGLAGATQSSPGPHGQRKARALRAPVSSSSHAGFKHRVRPRRSGASG